MKKKIIMKHNQIKCDVEPCDNNATVKVQAKYKV